MNTSLLPALTTPVLERVRVLEALLRERLQVVPVTEHLFHAGVYARTIALQPGHVVTGALMCRSTVLIVQGDVEVFTGEEVLHVKGYRILAGSAGRKSVFYARDNSTLTMIFATPVQSVEAAEREFTTEHALLASHDNHNVVVMTGE